MKAMILAAGRGERLRPLTDVTPKPLLEVRGKPLIVHHLEALAASGFGEIVINISWLGSKIQDLLGDGSNYGLVIRYSTESEPLETAGGIRHALPLLGESFIVVNADIVTNFDFSRLLQSQSPAHLVLVANPPHHADGDFCLEQGLITTVGTPRYTFSGISRFDARFFANLTPAKYALAPLLIAAAGEKRVTGEIFDGEWIDIGTVARLESVSD